jgi:hypothetical protein
MDVPIDSEKAKIKIRDLLTMSCGFAWDNELMGTSQYDNWISSPNQVLYVLTRTLDRTPG